MAPGWNGVMILIYLLKNNRNKPHVFWFDYGCRVVVYLPTQVSR